MKYAKLLTLIILCFPLLLGGCTSKDAGTVSNNGSDINTDIGKNVFEEKNEYTLSEYLNTGETIWYLTDGTAYDSTVKEIYVIASDGAIYYCAPEDCPTISSSELGDWEQEEDEDVISAVKKGYETHVLNKVNGFSRTAELIAKNSGEAASDVIMFRHFFSVLESYLNDIKPAHYQLVIETDSTGNNTKTETLYFEDSIPMDCMTVYGGGFIYHGIKKMELNSNDYATYNIYDSWYGGYYTSRGSVGSTDLPMEGYLLTRINSQDMDILLDTVGAENVNIGDTHSFPERERINYQY